jgi:hypothetical protein
MKTSLAGFAAGQTCFSTLAPPKVYFLHLNSKSDDPYMFLYRLDERNATVESVMHFGQF